MSLDACQQALIKPIKATPKRPMTCQTQGRPARQGRQKTVHSSLNECPSDKCIMKRVMKTTTWVQCAKCKQWFHIRCAGFSSKKQVEKDDFTFHCC